MGTKVGTRLGDEASRGNVVRSKTDQRYWADRVERRERGKAARRHVEGDYSVMMQFAGERRRVPLGTANKTTASHTAAAFYRSLLQKGWTGVGSIGEKGADFITGIFDRFREADALGYDDNIEGDTIEN